MANNKGKFGYSARGAQRNIVVSTRTTFNVDNGAGTTADDASVGPFHFDCYIIDARAVYTEATDTTGAASANFKTGVAVGGATLVAATALEAAKAIGGYTAGVPLDVVIPAGTAIWTRHTGVAATEVGQYFVQYTLLPKP
jgi:hypothetical protein